MRAALVNSGRGLILAVALGLLSPLGVGAVSARELIDLTIDFAKVMQLDRPADTIVVGNPGIADTTLGDEQTLVLTGKSAGTTNLIVFDAEGEEIIHATVRVSSDIQQLTTVFYGKQRQTFSCAPVCEHVISVGDDVQQFQNATTQIQTRQQFSLGQ